jgi:cellulose synthase/poly-beta-1,6-N-acetylglucosamine synthase-like glycosyltransferase
MLGDGDFTPLLVVLLAVVQVLYSLTFLVDFYHFSRPINRVDMAEPEALAAVDLPFIVLLYPVLNELEGTMHTTFSALARMDYPADRHAVVAIPNSDDLETIAALGRLQTQFPFLQVLEVPPTTDRSWGPIWSWWSANRNAYWWHRGRHTRAQDLPPKKTRQLIYAFRHLMDVYRDKQDFLVNYIDADSAPPLDHFRAGAIGMQRYDVLQAQNVAGNLNASLAASWHAFDHMAWDGMKYPHLSADGRHPYWVLGKGLFFRASDLFELGGFHPWVAIEDPEVGMRFWRAGKRLGIIEGSLIEEVPETFAHGITQRKRWVCGFFQSLGTPLKELDFSPTAKLKAWLNFLPCLSLWINAVGFPVGAWALIQWAQGADDLPLWLVILCTVNVIGFVLSLTALYLNTWRRTRLVLDRRRDRIWYMLRINPLFVMIWWVIWLVPLWLGFWMYMRQGGLVWERTEKINANEALIQSQVQKV